MHISTKMTSEYVTDSTVIENGMLEALKCRVNDLDSMMLDGSKSTIGAALNGYYQVRETARSFGISTDKYDSMIEKNGLELKRIWGVGLK